MKLKKIGIVLVVIIVLAAIGSGLGSDDEDAKNTEVSSEDVSQEAAPKEEQKDADSDAEKSAQKEDESAQGDDTSDAKETLSDLTDDLKDTVDESLGKNSNKEEKQHPGDTITFGDFKITYKSVEKYKSDNEFLQPKKGFQYLKFNFAFKNTGKSDSYIGDFSCYADGEKCDTAYVDDSASDFLVTKLSSGRKKNGSITFEIPKNVKLKDVELEYENNSLWSDKKIIFLAK